MQGLKVSSVGASSAFTIAGLRRSYPGARAFGGAMRQLPARPCKGRRCGALSRFHWQEGLGQIPKRPKPGRLMAGLRTSTPEQIDLDTFNPAHRDPAITTDAQLHSCARRRERKPSTIIEEIFADRRIGQFRPQLRCNPHDRSYEGVRVRTGPCSIVTPMAVPVISNRGSNLGYDAFRLGSIQFRNHSELPI